MSQFLSFGRNIETDGMAQIFWKLIGSVHQFSDFCSMLANLIIMF